MKMKTGVVRPVERPELLSAFAEAAGVLTLAQGVAGEAREAKWRLEEAARQTTGADRRKHLLELLLSEEVRRLAFLDLQEAFDAAHEAAQAVYRTLLQDVVASQAANRDARHAAGHELNATLDESRALHNNGVQMVNGHRDREATMATRRRLDTKLAGLRADVKRTGRVAGRQVGWAVGALEGAIGGMCQDCDKHGLMRFMHDRLREVANRPSLMRRIGYMRIRARNQVGRSRI